AGHDVAEAVHDARGADAAEVEALAARQDRHGDLLHLGGGEDELDVRRRLLERLEQGVESLPAQHVDFIDDVDLETGPGGPVLDVAADLADLVDAAVAGAVDLQHVHVLAGGDAAADLAGVAGRGGRAVDAVEGLGEDAGGGGLADAAGAGEQV